MKGGVYTDLQMASPYNSLIFAPVTVDLEIPSLRCQNTLMAIACDVQWELEEIEDNDLKEQLHTFVSQFVHMKKEDETKPVLNRDSVLRELKASFDQISNEHHVPENDFNSLNVTNDVLKTACKTLSRFEDLMTIRGKLTDTDGLLGGLCETLGWRVKDVTDVDPTSNNWGLSICRLLSRMKERLTAAKFRSAYDRKLILKTAKEDFEKAFKKYKQWNMRLAELKDAARGKHRKLNFLKSQVNNHETIQKRIRDQYIIESTGKEITSLRQDLITTLRKVTEQTIDVKHSIDKETQSNYDNLQNSTPTLRSCECIFKNLNGSLQTSLAHLKSKSALYPGDFYRLRKLQTAVSQVEKEMHALIKNAACVGQFTQTQIQREVKSSQSTISSGLSTEDPSEDIPLALNDVTSHASVLRNNVVELQKSSDAAFAGLLATRAGDSSLCFGAFKIEVIKFDLLHQKSFSDKIQDVLEYMLPVTCQQKASAHNKPRSNMGKSSLARSGEQNKGDNNPVPVIGQPADGVKCDTRCAADGPNIADKATRSRIKMKRNRAEHKHLLLKRARKPKS